MFYFKKNVRYYKFFEDIKLIQNDPFNNRLAIVFCGKERLIHIFDSSPYKDYIPIKTKDPKEYELQSQQGKTSNNNSLSSLEKNVNNEYVDIKKLFKDISNDQQQLAPQVILQNNVNTQQQYIIFHPNHIPKKQKDIDNQFEISHFDLYFEATIKKIEVKLDILKPRIKTKILSVIQTNTIKGIEWFFFQKTNPLLLVINIDNFIGVYKRRLEYTANGNMTQINKIFIQSQPFMNFPEAWIIFGSATQSIPIKDYYLKSSVEENVYKLFTIHADNNIYFWYIIYQIDSLKITPNFIISFNNNFIIDNIVVNSNETFLYCFNSRGMQIYKISSVLPFNLVYVYWYDEGNSSTQSQISQISQKKKKTIERLIPISFSSYSEEIDEELIDLSENVTREEVKFFKNLQKPVFSIIENVLFIQLFNANDNTYSLLYFDTQGLMKIFKDITFFEKCRQGKEKTLMKKFFVAKENFTFTLSPHLYIKKGEGKGIELGPMPLLTETDKDGILDNLHQILLISYNDTNQFYSLPAMMKDSSEVSSTILDSFQYKEKIDEEDDGEGDGNQYKSIIKWIEKNTIIISSLKFLFTIVKYGNQSDTFGIPVNYNKIKQFLLNNK